MLINQAHKACFEWSCVTCTCNMGVCVCGVCVLPSIVYVCGLFIVSSGLGYVCM